MSYLDYNRPDISALNGSLVVIPESLAAGRRISATGKSIVVVVPDGCDSEVVAAAIREAAAHVVALEAE